MPNAEKLKPEKEKKYKTKADSFLWGLIVLIPFGWIILWMNINERRMEVERGERDKQSAITSINNYAVGTVISFIIVFIIVTAQYQQTTQPLIVFNFVAITILAVSSIRNTSKIKNVGHKVDRHTEHDNEVADNDDDSEESTMTYDDYLAKVMDLKEELERLDPDDDSYEDDLLHVKNEINQFFNNCKDAEFEEGGKYKLYELKAEYFFVIGDKQQAKKYIEQAIEVRNKEKRRALYLSLSEDEDDEA